MAKLNIDTNHEYEYRDGTMTVADALKWVAQHATTEDEETGKVSTYSPGDLICYGVRRMMALHKDGARFAKGKAPSRIYTPRVAVEGAAKNAQDVKDVAREAFAKALHIAAVKHVTPVKAPTVRAAKPAAKPSPKPSPKPATLSKAERIAANDKRIKELEAAIAAKAAKSAPAAKPAQSAKARRPGVHRAEGNAADATRIVTVGELLARLAVR